MIERFRRSWRGTVTSSQGFSIRLNGRTTLLYRDALGEVVVSTEPLGGDGVVMAVYAESIPEHDGRSRAVTMNNIGRAFQHAGWTMVPS